MSYNIDNLCKDPLFQLNLVIWLTQPQPPQNFYVYPLFYNSNLNLYSIGPLLTLPLNIRLQISKGNLDCQDATRPDLILEGGEKNKFCILECKASSFGPNSSTAKQARTLLLISGPIISEVLGIGMRGKNEGILCYFSGSNQIEMIEDTLRNLTQEIENLNLKTGTYGCFGIKAEQSAILLEYSEKIKTSLNLKDDSPVEVIRFEKETDPRPLYFIPYDPNIQQTKEEQEFCRRILFERILSYIISKIGGATIPETITFSIGELLNFATFGLYKIWEDKEATKHVRRFVRDFLNKLKKAIDEPLRESITHEPEKGWTFNLKDKKIYEELLKQLQKFRPETLDLSKKVEPTLFDNLEE